MNAPDMIPNELLAARKLRSDAMRSARQAARRTKEDFAKSCGFTRATIDRIESGRGSWNADTEIIYLHNLGLVNFEPVYKEENGKMVITSMKLVPKK